MRERQDHQACQHLCHPFFPYHHLRQYPGRQRPGRERAEPRYSDIFVVRVEAEHLEEPPRAWSGEVEYVGRREVMRFDDVDEMLDCTRRLAARAENKREHEQVE